MRIAKTDIIAGLPAADARYFLRRVSHADFDEEWARSLLNSRGAADPGSTLTRFEEDGYIERADHSPDGLWWMTTTLGNALAMASFGKPITRKTADRLVAEMLDRARAYNADPGKPSYVKLLRLFGSYLNLWIDPLGDVDVELVLGRRVTDPKEVLRYVTASGRSFPTYIDKILWPQTEAVQTCATARLPSTSPRRTSTSSRETSKRSTPSPRTPVPSRRPTLSGWSMECLERTRPSPMRPYGQAASWTAAGT
ncbi:hypothetical protein [Arthrobacter sp. UYCu723]